jgi:hypothetical protein
MRRDEVFSGVSVGIARRRLASWRNRSRTTSEWARHVLEVTGFVTVEEWRAKPVTPNCLLTKPVTRNLTSASRAA